MTMQKFEPGYVGYLTTATMITNFCIMESPKAQAFHELADCRGK